MKVSEMFFNARTQGRRKRELATIAKQLCIKEEFLDALEKGEYGKIPELVYILGFARNYAIELGLDPNEVIKKIKEEMGIRPEFDDEEEDIKETPTGHGKIKIFLAKHWKKITIGAGALIVALVCGLTIAHYANKPADEPEVEEAAQATLPPLRLPVRESFGNRANSQVVLQATAETWVKVEDARGEILFSRVMVAGDIYFAPENVKATLGNAGGIEAWVNGKLAPKLGAAHARKNNVSLNADALLGQQ